jgi:hypothetical protein
MIQVQPHTQPRRRRPRAARPAILLAAAGALLAVAPASAAPFLDPAGDFLPTFTGPQNADLDVLSVAATYNGVGVTLVSTQSGAIGTTLPALFLWGVNRGSGTDRLISSGPPPVGPPDILLDTVVRIEPNGGGRVVQFPTVGVPITTLIDPSLITISGSTISAFIPFALLPSTGFAAKDYTYIYWTRSEFGSQSFIADLAPDEHSFAAAPAPEPAAWALMLLGLAATGLAVRRARTPARA